jgi:hypothetical protein
MEIEIDEMAARHDSNKKIFDDFAGLCSFFWYDRNSHGACIDVG